VLHRLIVLVALHSDKILVWLHAYLWIHLISLSKDHPTKIRRTWLHDWSVLPLILKIEFLLSLNSSHLVLNSQTLILELLLWLTQVLHIMNLLVSLTAGILKLSHSSHIHSLHHLSLILLILELSWILLLVVAHILSCSKISSLLLLELFLLH
jgi:hypothetical protein